MAIHPKYSTIKIIKYKFNMGRVFTIGDDPRERKVVLQDRTKPAWLKMEITDESGKTSVQISHITLAELLKKGKINFIN